MHFFTHLKKALLTKVTVAFLVTLFLVPVNLYFFAPNHERVPFFHTVEAITVTEVGPNVKYNLKTSLESTLTTINTSLSSVSTNALWQKEYFFDKIAYTAAKVFLHKLVADIVAWINSGFQGQPAFMTDLRGWLLEVSDETIGQFIYDSDTLNFLCSPFQLDVKIAILANYSSRVNYQPQCTLTDVVANVEGFLGGTFSDGGWPGWFELHMSEESNPTSAYLNAEAEAYARIIDAQGNTVKELEFGDGFWSMEVCDIAEKSSGTRPNCIIGTPGSVIANSINKALGAGQDELIAADEINEIFNALIAQLVKKVFSGAGGLLGIGGNTNYSGYESPYATEPPDTRSFQEQIAAEDNRIFYDKAYFDADNPLYIAIDNEEEYRDANKAIVDEIGNAKVNHDYRAETLLNDDCYVPSFPPRLLSDSREAQFEANSAQNTINSLQIIQAEYDAAGDAASKQLAMDKYLDLVMAGVLHTPAQTTSLEFDLRYDISDDINDHKSNLSEAERNCEPEEEP